MPVGTPGFLGERLTQAREARGMSAVSLSELVGVSASTISQYEHNHQKPPHDVLEKLALQLNVPRAYFLRPLPDSIAAKIFYRSMSSATKGARLRAERRFEWLKEIVDYLNSLFDLPCLRLPRVNTPTDFRQIPNQFLESTAAEIRRFWGVGAGPFPHAVRLLERNGVIVSRGNLQEESLDAFSEYASDQQAFIFLGSGKDCFVRSRFDVLHELAHLILHRHVDRKAINTPQDFRLLENQAHYLSSAIQLPEKDFTAELWSPTLDSFLALKERWKVSIGTMIHRCLDLGIISDSEAKRLFINRTRRGWRKHEPLDDTLPVERPELLMRCFELLVTEGGKSKADIVDEICLVGNDIEELAGLPRGFLSNKEPDIIPLPVFKREESRPSGFSAPADVIPFKANE